MNRVGGRYGELVQMVNKYMANRFGDQVFCGELVNW